VEEEVTVSVSVAVAVVVGAALWLATTAAHCPSRGASVKTDSWVVVSDPILHWSSGMKKEGLDSRIAKPTLEPRRADQGTGPPDTRSQRRGSLRFDTNRLGRTGRKGR
jgi:hypothetical protein